MTQLGCEKSRLRMLFAQTLNKIGCSEVFNCSVGSSNFSVLYFVVVIVCLQNVASEVALCENLYLLFFFFNSKLLDPMVMKTFWKCYSWCFILVLFFLNH